MLSCIEQKWPNRIECVRKKVVFGPFFGATSHSYRISVNIANVYSENAYKHTHTHLFIYTHSQTHKKTVFSIGLFVCRYWLLLLLSSLFATFFCVCMRMPMLKFGLVGLSMIAFFFVPRILIIAMC